MIKDIQIKTNYDTVFVLSRMYNIACENITTPDRGAKTLISVLHSLDTIFQRKLLVQNKKSIPLKLKYFQADILLRFITKINETLPPYEVSLIQTLITDIDKQL